MPKREADSYITKENGITANTSQGEDKPKMSTAAQLAKRKQDRYAKRQARCESISTFLQQRQRTESLRTEHPATNLL
ncbi:hypothetical protein EDD36DRAFT_73674 [Exophiala viscosa]|uniref:Uncharacterized protein n=1 Tax=Exophiala viscosa TaxID=2486360 RepID=A0AAN6DPY6_9EURO|nr:hypothetical protein EDD36DRAFT_73674 [Exophiala viscosa]